MNIVAHNTLASNTGDNRIEVRQLTDCRQLLTAAKWYPKHETPWACVGTLAVLLAIHHKWEGGTYGR